jgi:hypothetical protein
MVPPPKLFLKAPMPKTPDDMSNAAVQKRVALTKIFKGSAPKEQAAPATPKVRIAKGR